MFTPLLWINPLESFKWCLEAINVDKRQSFKFKYDGVNFVEQNG